MSEVQSRLTGEYHGERKPLFSLAFKTAILTALTVGIYRFWAKTRIRKYIWSSVAGQGDAFEYTGTGLEKFLGFLMAIVILAVYLGIIQMILFYFGLTLFTEPRTEAQMLAQMGAFYITFFAVLPLIFFAQYRARRYKLARSRWRGVRFGMEKGAWGYALRAIGHWLLTIVTLGLLLPRQTFYLEKYMTDRTWYGDGKFEQQGKWTALYPAMKHLAIGLAIMVVGSILGGVAGSGGIIVITALVGYIWFMVGLVSYRVKSFIYLTDTKVLDGAVTFDATPQTSTIVSTVLVGGLVVGLIVGLVFAVVGGVASAMMGPLMFGHPAAQVIGGLVIAAIYLLVLAMAGALSLVWITQPVIAHVVTEMKVHGAEHLNTIKQRAHDSGADAEGFADALDVGGAI
ncbi:DUF898 family protein [Roseovarius sp. MMSF_3281]|uniref:DUF898 family protein n=1 Tax=Roseovarius sp. MMSF_3281 TaxID=3046694 RepID=UPI00273FA6E8|nr:DUF898 family protein [Roseovarius sp. MMSF_3281]